MIEENVTVAEHKRHLMIKTINTLDKRGLCNNHRRRRHTEPVSICRSYQGLFGAPKGCQTETEFTRNSEDPGDFRNYKRERSAHITMTSPVCVISFQKVIRPDRKDQFSLRTTGAGVRIVTHCMTCYKAIQCYLSQHNF
jgi:hypothetical protein